MQKIVLSTIGSLFAAAFLSTEPTAIKGDFAKPVLPTVDCACLDCKCAGVCSCGPSVATVAPQPVIEPVSFAPPALVTTNADDGLEAKNKQLVAENEALRQENELLKQQVARFSVVPAQAPTQAPSPKQAPTVQPYQAPANWGYTNYSSSGRRRLFGGRLSGRCASGSCGN